MGIFHIADDGGNHPYIFEIPYTKSLFPEKFTRALYLPTEMTYADSIGISEIRRHFHFQAMIWLFLFGNLCPIYESRYDIGEPFKPVV